MIHRINKKIWFDTMPVIVALWRGEAHSCPVILGSATPAITSYYKAKQGEYHLLELPHRIFEQPMPKVTIVDMKEEISSW